MSAANATTRRVVLGLRAMRGGGVVVGVVLESSEPRVVLSSFLATGAEGDRLSREPFAFAAEMERAANGGASAEVAAAVAEGRKRQEARAARGLQEILYGLSDFGWEPVGAALLVNRAGWVTDLLAYSLASPDHLAVAEGLAVREALRFAVAQAGVAVRELDEKSLPDLALKRTPDFARRA